MVHNTIDWQAISTHISNTTGQYFEVQTHYPIAGGNINYAYRIEGAGQNYFVKLNTFDKFDMFVAEAMGLAELGQPAVIKVPVPICWGKTAEHAYLVLEYLPLRRDNLQQTSSKFGQQLAVMHRVSCAPAPFGWYRNNYIGTTPQTNTLAYDWVDFWCKNRLGYQLQLAHDNGYIGEIQELGARLLTEVALFFTTYKPYNSLLHGDLWSGNYDIDIHGEPVIFDPAMYYGDREADIATTELFGGFHTSFYDAYQATWALDEGYTVRKNLYNLYHVLNHLNLFGGSYLAQAERIMHQLLSELH
ncbi:fructosamine kinase family protein [Beggiatoa leptomitoformis]|uniref:Phosphotransferase n=1 Tax=Beggiatoa leptomitoformis TaxID=288004 RepID=A0A2N9YAQ2_9GAMM|nr:fructosamine kinase family protein [Beggiatoa leptomitoformis]ALG67079.1 phosphotransferase [Beggiatoa leptomitoformis]AUI67530.1 phosphotransferase [Beggiatoa leptomitoformis]